MPEKTFPTINEMVAIEKDIEVWAWSVGDFTIEFFNETTKNFEQKTFTKSEFSQIVEIFQRNKT